MNAIEWVASRASDLPTLPQVASRILERVKDPRATAAELGGIILRDQAMVTKLLRMANSALYAPRVPVTDVRRAIVVLGFGTLRSTVMAAATQSLYRSKRSRLKDYLLWEHSLAVAVGSRILAAEVRYPAPEEAFVAGLLHDVGKIVLDQTLEEQYQAVIERVFNEQVTCLEAERAALGYDHTEVGGLVTRRWNLATPLIEAAELHHRPEEAASDPLLCSVVHLANNLAIKMEIGPERRPDLDLLSLSSVERLGIDEARLELVQERLSGRLHEERAVFEEEPA